MQCLPGDGTKCHVRLLKCKVRSDISLYITSDSVEISTNGTICCERSLSIQSTQTIHVQSPVTGRCIELASTNGEIRLSTECTVQTQSFYAKGSKTFVMGSVVDLVAKNGHKELGCDRGISKNREDKEIKPLTINIKGSLHTGRESVIGQHLGENISHTVRSLTLCVSENICNFGKIIAEDTLSIECMNLLTCKDTCDDTAHRFLEAIEAITNPNNVNEKRGTQKYFSLLMDALRKQKGTISANTIMCKVSENVEDVSQLYAENVIFEVLGNITDEKYAENINLEVVENITGNKVSVWTSGRIQGHCDGSFTINEKAHLQQFDSFEAKTVCIEEDAYISVHHGGHMVAKEHFHNKGTIYHHIGQLRIDTGEFQQNEMCRLQSKDSLKLTIAKNSSQWGGSVDAKRIMFVIAANVTEKCQIKANEICVVQIKRSTKSSDHCMLLHKGNIKVAKGNFIAVSDKSDMISKKSEMVDVVFDGSLTARGISASTAFIRMLAKSEITLLPNRTARTRRENLPTTNEDLNTEHTLTTAGYPVIELLTNILHTENNSKISMRIVATHAHVEVCCKNELKHKGTIHMAKDDKCRGVALLRVGKLINHGCFENIDELEINVQKNMSNFASVSVLDRLIITGKGNIFNHKGSNLQCRNGSLIIHGIQCLNNSTAASIDCYKELSMKTLLGKDPRNAIAKNIKFDVTNKGTITCVEKITIEAGNIRNMGTIQSMQSDINLIWTTNRHRTKLKGVVKSPTLMKFIIYESKQFYCKCAGGLSDSDTCDKLVLPKQGLSIKCINGTVVLDNEIYGNSPLLVTSQKACCIIKNIAVPVLRLFPRYSINCKQQTHIANTESETNKLSIKDKVESIESVKHCSDVFYIYVLHSSVLKVRKMSIKSEEHQVNVLIKTPNGGKLSCANLLNVNNSILTIKGQLEVGCSCTINAQQILVNSDSLCRINEKTEYTHQNADDSGKLRILAENEIVLNGEIFHEIKDQCQVVIHSKNDNIEVGGLIVVPELVIVASGVICFTGKAEVSGPLCLVNACHIDLQKTANICCQGFFCEPLAEETEHVASSFTLAGVLNVTGSVRCLFTMFQMEDKSLFSIQQNDKPRVSDTAETNSEITEETVLIDVKRSANLSGELKCKHKNCQLLCLEELKMDHFQADIFSNDFIFQALKEIKICTSCKVYVQKGKLTLTCAEEGKEEISGNIFLGGMIQGTNDILTGTFDRFSQTSAIIEIEGRNVSLINATLKNFHSTEIIAAMTLTTDEKSIFQTGTSMTLIATTMEFKGIIQNYCSLHLNVSNMLVLGKMFATNEIKIEAELAVVNSGEVRANKTGIAAPFYVNCPAEIIGNIDVLPQLGGEGQHELIVEGLLCIIVGSHLHGTSITIKSVLHFEFATKKSTIPSTDDLDHWKDFVNKSLSNLKFNDTEAIHGLVQQTLSLPKVICHLGVASNLCKNIVAISQKVCDNGLKEFKIQDIIGCLNTAHQRYSSISPLTLPATIRAKIRKVKYCAKQVGRKMMDNIFGSKSFSKSLKFKSSDGSDISEGINTWHFVYEGKETDVTTNGMYKALSLELNGCKGIWKNEGRLEACGDIFISASIVKQSGARNRLMKSLIGSINVNADTADIENTQSQHLNVQASENAKIVSATVEHGAVIESKQVNAQKLKAESLNVHALNTADVTSVEIKEDVVISSEGKTTMENVKSKAVQIMSKEDINIGNIKTGEVVAISETGNLILDSSVHANEATLRAKNGDVSLSGKSGKANHHISVLHIDTKYFENIDKLLNKSGLYEDLKISDHLGLMVEDQSIVLTHYQKLDHSVCIRGASIEVNNTIDTTKRIELEAVKGRVIINSDIKGKDDITLIAKTELKQNAGSTIDAGENVGLESKSSSVDIKNGKITGNTVTVIAKKDINIQCKRSTANGPSAKSVIQAASVDKTDVEPSIILQSGNNINIEASDVINEGDTVISAKGDINITANTYTTVQCNETTSWIGFRKDTDKTTTTHVERSNITGKGNVFNTGGKFKSIASKIKSKKGTKIHSKEKVSMWDIVVNKEKNKTTNVLGGYLYNYNETRQCQMSHGTLVEDTSNSAQTEITSDTSDIEWKGSSVKTEGDFKETANHGNICHSRRILSQSVDVGTCGLSSSGFSFGLHCQYTAERKQFTSEDNITVGGNCEIAAKEFEALESFEIRVNKDMTVNAKKVRFEGAALENTYSDKGLDFAIDKTSMQLGFQYGHEKATHHQLQKSDIGGNFTLSNVDKVIFDTCDTNVGAIKGNIKEMEVLSRADTEEKTNLGTKIEVDMVTKTPGIDFELKNGRSKRVNKMTTINSREGSEGLSVDKLTLTGAAIAFDGDVHDFARDVVTNKIHEMDSEFNIDLRIRKPKPSANAIKGKISLGVKGSKRQLTSCISSKGGQISDSLKRKVNHDPGKLRTEGVKFGFSFSREFECKPSAVISSITKQLLKSTGNEICEYLNKELNLPLDIVKDILAIAKSENPVSCLYQVVAPQLVKANIPQELISALESLISAGDPILLIQWICKTAKIDIEIITGFVIFLHSKKSPQDRLGELAMCIGKYLGFSEQDLCILHDIIKYQEVKAARKACKTLTITSKPGQRMIRNTCAVLKIPPEIIDVILDFLKQPTLAAKSFVILKSISMRVNLSGDLVNAIQDVLESHDLIKLAEWGCGQLHLKRSLVRLVVPIIKECNSVEKMVPALLRCTAKQFGISEAVISGVDTLISGKLPNGGIHALVIQAVKDIINTNKGKACKLTSVRRFEALITDILSVQTLTDISQYFDEQITSKKKHSFAFMLTMFMVETKSAPHDTFGCLGRMLTNNNNPNFFHEWLLKTTKIPQDLSVLFLDILHCSSFEHIILDLIQVVTLRVKSLSEMPDLLKDIRLIVVGQSPETVLKCLNESLVSEEQLTAVQNLFLGYLGLKTTVTDSEIVSAKCQMMGIPSRIEPVISMLLTCDISTLSKSIKLYQDKQPQSFVGLIDEAIEPSDIQTLLVISKCIELNIPKELFSVVVSIINYAHNANVTRIIEELAVMCGIPKDLVLGLSKLIVEKDDAKLIEWISLESSVRPEVIDIGFKLILHKDLNTDNIISMIKHVGTSFDMPDTVLEKIEPALNGNLSLKEMKMLLFQMSFQMVAPYILQVTQELELPQDFFQVLVGFVETGELQSLGIRLVEMLTKKVGVSNEVFNAFKSVAIEANYEPMARWISDSSGADGKLILSLLNSLKNGKTVIEGIKKFPRFIAQHYNLPKEVVDGLVCLTEGRTFKGDIKQLCIQAVTKICQSDLDQPIFSLVFNVIEASDWIIRSKHLLCYFASNYDIPCEYVDGLEDLIQNQNPTKLVASLANQLDIDKGLLMILANAFIKGDSPKQIFRNLSKAIGIPAEVVMIIEEIVTKKSNSASFESGLKLAKAIGKSAFSKYGEDVAEKLGLPTTIVKGFLDIYSGEIQPANVAKCVAATLAKACLPQDLVCALETLLLKHDPIGLISWVCKQNNIEMGIFLELIDVVKKQSPETALNKIIEYAVKKLELPASFTLAFKEIISSSRGNISKQKCPKANAMVIIKSEEGQIMLRACCEALKVPTTTVDLIAEFTKQSTPVEYCFILTKAFSRTLGFPERFIESIKHVLLSQDHDKLLEWGCAMVGLDNDLAKLFCEEIKKKRCIKTTIQSMLKCIAKHYGIPNEMVTSMEIVISRKPPKGCSKLAIIQLVRNIFSYLFPQLGLIFDTLSNQHAPHSITKAILLWVTMMTNKSSFNCDTMAELQIRLTKQDPFVFTDILLKKIHISMDLVKLIKNVLTCNSISDFTTILIRDFLPKKFCHPEVKTLITDVVSAIQGKPQKGILKQLKESLMVNFKEVAKDLMLSKSKEWGIEQGSTLQKDVILLFEGKQPEHELKRLQGVFDILEADLQTKKSKCDKLHIPQKLMDDCFCFLKNKNQTTSSSLSILFKSYVETEILKCVKYQIHDWLGVKIGQVDKENLTSKIKELGVTPSLLAVMSKCFTPAETIADMGQTFGIELSHQTTSNKGRLDIESNEVETLLIVCKCIELRIPAALFDVLVAIVNNKVDMYKICKAVAGVCELPEYLTCGLLDLVLKKDHTGLANWISDKTSFPKDVVEICFRKMLNKDVDKPLVISAIKSVGKMLNMSDSLIKKLETAINGKLSPDEAKMMLFRMCIDIVTPHVYNIADKQGVPKEIIEMLIGFVDSEDVFVHCIKFIEFLLTTKTGVPPKTVKVFTAILCDKNYQPLTSWINDQTGIDEKLVLSILNTITNGKTFVEGIKKIPCCISQHFNMSKEVVGGIQCIVEGKRPKCDMKQLLIQAANDICKVVQIDKSIFNVLLNIIETNDWLERAIHLLKYFASKFDVPAECVNGVRDLIQNKDPTTIVKCLANKLDIDIAVLIGIVDAVITADNGQQTLQKLVKVVGIPEEAIKIAEELFFTQKKQTNKQNRQLTGTSV